MVQTSPLIEAARKDNTKTGQKGANMPEIGQNMPVNTSFVRKTTPEPPFSLPERPAGKMTGKGATASQIRGFPGFCAGAICSPRGDRKKFTENDPDRIAQDFFVGLRRWKNQGQAGRLTEAAEIGAASMKLDDK